MRSKVSKLVLTLMLVLGMTVSVLAVTKAADADPTEIAWDGYTQEDLNALAADEIPAMDGYLFGGWYKQECDGFEAEYANYLSTAAIPDGATEIYAKFVPKAVLGVKAQLSTDDLNGIVQGEYDEGEYASLRFVTTVDSLVYQQVGFDIEYVKNNESQEKHYSSNEVYTRLLATDGSGNVTDEYIPDKMFSTESEYFKTCKISKIYSNYCDVLLNVTPYWVTMNGKKVCGDTVSINASQRMTSLSEIYVASNGEDGAAGTSDAPLATLAHAMYRADSTASINVQDDIEANTTATIQDGKNITIKSAGSEKEVIYRGTGLSASQMFYVSSGCKLTVQNVILDGRTEATKSVTDMDSVPSGEQTLITNKGTLNFNDSVVQYVKRTSGNSAVCNSSGTVTATDTDFQYNKAAEGNGGVIVTNSNKLTLTNCTFTGNIASGSGGAIYVNGGSSTAIVTGCTFNLNKSIGGHGGAIYTEQKMSVGTSMFTENEALASGKRGGAIYSIGSSLTLEGQSGSEKYAFNTNKASDGGGAIAVDGDMELFKVKYYKFYDNSVSRTGGGAIVLAHANIEAELTECVFDANKGPRGGAICAETFSSSTNPKASEVTITDCSFTNNESVASSNTKLTAQGGGAIWTQGKVTLNLMTDVKSTMALFDGNKTHNLGGDIYLIGTLSGSGYEGLTEDDIYASNSNKYAGYEFKTEN